MLTVYMPVMAATTTFSDVENNSTFRNAIYTLADFGIILGDAGSDTFRPKANISREEFSVIMTRVLGLGALNVTVTEYPFPDVTPSTAADWSIKATKIAYDLGIIKGFEDGTFRPKENVTFEQAVKMIVCTLGYEGSAIEQGGWPNGYIAVARGFGILNNAEAPQALPASREIIAQLVANSLEVALAETEVSESRTLLSEKLRYTEGTGVITGVEGKALKSNASGILADEVQINNALKFKVGDTSAKEYFGKQVKYYYKESDEVKTLVSARLTNKNREVTVPSTLIKKLYTTKIEYYESLDNTNVFETYVFETGSKLSVIYNGRYAAQIDPAKHTPTTGTIRLIDNDGNGLYDVVIIDKTRVCVVSSVNSVNKIVYDAYLPGENDALKLNDAKNPIDVTIVKANTVVDFNQIKKGDVLLVSESDSPTGRKAYNIEIVTNTVSGNVTSMNASYGEVIISGNTYELSSEYTAAVNGNKAEAINIGDKVTVYLDSNNKILAASVTSVAATTKYGYLIETSTPAQAEKDEEVLLKVYTIDGKAVNFKGAQKIMINGSSVSYEKVPDVLDSTNSADEKGNPINADIPEALTELDSKIAAEQDAAKKDQLIAERNAINSNYKRAQFIKYTTNSSGAIDNIYTLKAEGDTDKGLIRSRAYQTNVKYLSSGRKLGSNLTLSTTTKVMIVPSNRYETTEYSVGTYSKLKNNATYAFEAYDCSETNVPAVVVVYGSPASVGLNDPTVTFALIDSIKATSKDGESITSLTCKVDGSSKTYYTADATLLSNYVKGDVVKLAFDAKGYIKEVAKVFKVDNPPAVGSYTYTASDRTATTNKAPYVRVVENNDGTNYYTTVFGTVYAVDAERMVISPHDIQQKTVTDESGRQVVINTLDDSANRTITFSSSTKIFILDKSVPASNANRLKEGTVDSISSFMSASTGASQAFVYSRGSVVRFILVII